MANKLLILYYLYLIASYALVVYWLLLPGPRDTMSDTLDDFVRSLLYHAMISSSTAGDKVGNIFRNMNVYLLTCVAITDVFIMLIVEEHLYAYGELEEDLPEVFRAETSLSEGLAQIRRVPRRGPGRREEVPVEGEGCDCRVGHSYEWPCGVHAFDAAKGELPQLPGRSPRSVLLLRVRRFPLAVRRVLLAKSPLSP